MSITPIVVAIIGLMIIIPCIEHEDLLVAFEERIIESFKRVFKKDF